MQMAEGLSERKAKNAWQKAILMTGQLVNSVDENRSYKQKTSTSARVGTKRVDFRCQQSVWWSEENGVEAVRYSLKDASSAIAIQNVPGD